MTVNDSVQHFSKEDFKVLVFANGSAVREDGQPLKLTRVRLPHPRDDKPCSFLVDEHNRVLYELKKLNFYNEELPAAKRPLTTSRGECLNSVIIEREGSQQGMVFEEPELWVASKFNIVFLLLSFFERNIEKLASDPDTSTGTRYVGLDDITENMRDDSDSNLKDLPDAFFVQDAIGKSLALICDTLEQSGEMYYKLSLTKVLAFLKSRVERVTDNFPRSIMDSLLKTKVYPPNTDDVPEETVRAVQKIYSIQLVGSYLPVFYVKQLQIAFAQDIVVGETHMAKVADQLREQKAAQKNIEDLNASLSTSTSSKKRKAPALKKKEPVKVAKGSGALDSFFKRA